MRRCFIHIGTHKTGTTSLQVLLNHHSPELKSRHFLYPQAGRPREVPHGHHNIAWEISCDWRFDPAHGTIDDLIAEIHGVTHDIILSSEDFECSVYHRERFESFVQRLQSCSLAVTPIVYLRNQIDYCLSLYMTMLGHGMADTFNHFLGDVLNTGRFCWRDWIFPFCYRELLDRLERIFVEIIVRSYDRPKHGSLIGDWFAVCGLDPAECGIDTDTRLNVGAKTLDAVKLFCHNRGGRPLDSSANHVLASLCGVIDLEVDMSDRSKSMIASRFSDSNRYVARRYGLGELENSTRSRAAGWKSRHEPGVPAEVIFSAALLDQLERIARAFRDQRSVLLPRASAARAEG